MSHSQTLTKNSGFFSPPPCQNGPDHIEIISFGWASVASQVEMLNLCAFGSHEPQDPAASFKGSSLQVGRSVFQMEVAGRKGVAESGVREAGGSGAVASGDLPRSGLGDYEDVPGQHGLGVGRITSWNPEDTFPVTLDPLTTVEEADVKDWKGGVRIWGCVC